MTLNKDAIYRFCSENTSGPETPAMKASQSEEIKKQTEQFLKDGGEIKQLPPDATGLTRDGLLKKIYANKTPGRTIKDDDMEERADE